MRILIIFIFLFSNSFADEILSFKNIVINKELKKYDGLVFLDDQNQELSLDDYRGKLVILNFWATWCAPCREEMPSLDSLQENNELKNLKIFPINIGKESIEKSKIFFNELEIKNLQLYFDTQITLAKKLSLRGIPTTLLFNKDGKEFARIVGSIDFSDKQFIKWLASYN
tara:strand:+ start:314 stop:823 length:510 start_codon:yes stop_codon:yes gene_type:complete